MLHLDYRDGRPIYVQIMDDLRRQIALGTLPPGEKLPSVRELAARLSINPNTIQRAYRQLEMDGWICTVAGKGCFVAEKNLDLIREQQLKTLEDHLSAAAELAKSCGVTPAELQEMLRILLEEESQ